jgi:hypothetical protein
MVFPGGMDMERTFELCEVERFDGIELGPNQWMG